MTHKKNARTQRSDAGFTLVELSIVLVIIGLIIGGILVGQDLIKAATARSQIRQFDEINTALNTFRLKYNALPGDYGAAVLNLGAVAGVGTGNGNANSLLEDSDGATGGYADLGDAEMLGFWHHLGLAGFMAGGAAGTGTTVGTTWPRSKIGNLGIVAFFSPTAVPGGRLNYHLGKLGGDATTFGNLLTTNQAEEIDQKIDNGLANSGSIVARGAGTIDSAPIWSAADGTLADCVDGAGSTSAATATSYNTVDGAGQAGVGAICSLRVKMSY